VLASKPEVEAAFPSLTPGASVVAAPVAARGRSFGALLVACPDTGDRQARLRFVSALAELAAASLASAERLTATSEEARRDALTGLGNQRAFQEHLEATLQATEAAGGELALVLFDLDDLKRINDSEGHLVGDQVLKEIARQTLGMLRSGEEAFRTGGDEFALVVEGGRDAGKRVADRVRRAVVRKRRGHVLPAISAGIAAFPADAVGKDALVHKADLALYAAKERGKNRVVSYQDRLEAGTQLAQAEVIRRREAEWWQKVLGFHGIKNSLADELGPGCRPQEVAVLAERVAVRLGLGRRERRAIVLAALLTELSKLRIPESIRKKRGPLNEGDWQVVRESAELTASALQPIGSLRDVVDVVHACRERWDGSGFPHGLSGPEIPVGARVVAVSEAFIAMTSGRSYRPARTRARAMLELEEQAGSHFDPSCVQAMLDELDGPSPVEEPSPPELRAVPAPG
jgi:diguanylate cyclase (GGDEF)-like protein